MGFFVSDRTKFQNALARIEAELEGKIEQGNPEFAFEVRTGIFPYRFASNPDVTVSAVAEHLADYLDGTDFAIIGVDHHPGARQAWFQINSTKVQHASAGGIADELDKLDQLRQRGVITAGEFASQKARLLGSP